MNSRRQQELRTRRPANSQAGSSALPQRRAVAPAGRDRKISLYAFVGLLVLHMALARVEKGRPLLVMLHGLTALGAALIYGTDPRRPGRTIQAVAYICGAEVFWKMCVHSGALPWEFGKLAVIAVLLVAFVRGNRFRGAWLPALYFALLLPSALLTFARMDLDSARQTISGNLSGPLALALSLVFMSQVRLTCQEITRILCCFLVPLAGVAFLCYSGTFGAAEVTFGSSSNHAASGGFAPNQVSAELGFGILCALFWFLLVRRSRQLKGLLLLLALWFAVQSGLTFSRTGLYLTGLSAAVGVMPLLRTARARWTTLGLATATFLLAHFLVVPCLDAFTQGAFENRFRNTDLSSRADFWTTELQLFMTHPLLGVGVGVSDSTRMEAGESGIQAHTEYTRLLADHGLLGLAALVVLMWCVYRGFRQPRTTYGMAFCWAMTTFGLLFLVVSATRLALPALAFGLAPVRFLPNRGSRPNLRPASSLRQPGRGARLAGLRQRPAQS